MLLFFENWLMKLKCPRECSLMTSLVFWPFLTYLPTLSYSIKSLFGGYLGSLPTLIWDVINERSPKFLKPLGTLIYQNSQIYYPSEPLSFHHFTMRHPVVQDSSNILAKLAAKNNVAVNWLFGKRLNSNFYWQLKVR